MKSITSERKVNPVVRLIDHRRNLTNEDIITGLARNEPEAAIALYERFSDRINRLVWRILGGDDEHEDVVQQVFIQALGSAHSVRDPAALESWMVGVTLNTIRREIRTRKLRRSYFAPSQSVETMVGKPTQDGQLVVRQLYQAIRKMRASDQIVFTLRFVEGHSLDEVASACSCSRTTVKRRLARAKRSFMKQANRDSVLMSWMEEGKRNES